MHKRGICHTRVQNLLKGSEQKELTVDYSYFAIITLRFLAKLVFIKETEI